jgi:hypothetical protein
VLLVPVDAAVDGMAVLVPLGVEGRRAAAGRSLLAPVGLLVGLDRNGRRDATSPQTAPVGPGRVGLVTSTRSGRVRGRPGPDRRRRRGPARPSSATCLAGCPSCSPTRRQAAFTLNFSGLSTRSQAKRTDRSRSSSGYFLGAGTIPLSRGFRPAPRPGTLHLDARRDVVALVTAAPSRGGVRDGGGGVRRGRAERPPRRAGAPPPGRTSPPT